MKSCHLCPEVFPTVAELVKHGEESHVVECDVKEEELNELYLNFENDGVIDLCSSESEDDCKIVENAADESTNPLSVPQEDISVETTGKDSKNGTSSSSKMLDVTKTVQNSDCPDVVPFAADSDSQAKTEESANNQRLISEEKSNDREKVTSFWNELDELYESETKDAHSAKDKSESIESVKSSFKETEDTESAEKQTESVDTESAESSIKRTKDTESAEEQTESIDTESAKSSIKKTKDTELASLNTDKTVSIDSESAECPSKKTKDKAESAKSSSKDTTITDLAEDQTESIDTESAVSFSKKTHGTNGETESIDTDSAQSSSKKTKDTDSSKEKTDSEESSTTLNCKKSSDKSKKKSSKDSEAKPSKSSNKKSLREKLSKKYKLNSLSWNKKEKTRDKTSETLSEDKKESQGQDKKFWKKLKIKKKKKKWTVEDRGAADGRETPEQETTPAEVQPIDKDLNLTVKDSKSCYICKKKWSNITAKFHCLSSHLTGKSSKMGEAVSKLCEKSKASVKSKAKMGSARHQMPAQVSRSKSATSTRHSVNSGQVRRDSNAENLTTERDNQAAVTEDNLSSAQAQMSTSPAQQEPCNAVVTGTCVSNPVLPNTLTQTFDPLFASPRRQQHKRLIVPKSNANLSNFSDSGSASTTSHQGQQAGHNLQMNSMVLVGGSVSAFSAPVQQQNPNVSVAQTHGQQNLGQVSGYTAQFIPVQPQSEVVAVAQSQDPRPPGRPKGSPLRFSCPLCPDTSYSSSNGRDYHVKLKHISLMKLPCVSCVKDMSNTAEFLTHICEVHLKANHYVCIVCGFIPKSSLGLRKHLLIHDKKAVSINFVFLQATELNTGGLMFTTELRAVYHKHCRNYKGPEPEPVPDVTVTQTIQDPLKDIADSLSSQDPSVEVYDSPSLLDDFICIQDDDEEDVDDDDDDDGYSRLVIDLTTTSDQEEDQKVSVPHVKQEVLEIKPLIKKERLASTEEANPVAQTDQTNTIPADRPRVLGRAIVKTDPAMLSMPAEFNFGGDAPSSSINSTAERSPVVSSTESGVAMTQDEPKKLLNSSSRNSRSARPAPFIKSVRERLASRNSESSTPPVIETPHLNKRRSLEQERVDISHSLEAQRRQQQCRDTVPPNTREDANTPPALRDARRLLQNSVLQESVRTPNALRAARRDLQLVLDEHSSYGDIPMPGLAQMAAERPGYDLQTLINGSPPPRDREGVSLASVREDENRIALLRSMGQEKFSNLSGDNPSAQSRSAPLLREEYDMVSPANVLPDARVESEPRSAVSSMLTSTAAAEKLANPGPPAGGSPPDVSPIPDIIRDGAASNKRRSDGSSGSPAKRLWSDGSLEDDPRLSDIAAMRALYHASPGPSPAEDTDEEIAVLETFRRKRSASVIPPVKPEASVKRSCQYAGKEMDHRRPPPPYPGASIPSVTPGEGATSASDINNMGNRELSMILSGNMGRCNATREVPKSSTGFEQRLRASPGHDNSGYARPASVHEGSQNYEVFNPARLSMQMSREANNRQTSLTQRQLQSLPQQQQNIPEQQTSLLQQHQQSLPQQQQNIPGQHTSLLQQHLQSLPQQQQNIPRQHTSLLQQHLQSLPQQQQNIPGQQTGLLQQQLQSLPQQQNIPGQLSRPLQQMENMSYPVVDQSGALNFCPSQAAQTQGPRCASNQRMQQSTPSLNPSPANYGVTSPHESMYHIPPTPPPSVPPEERCPSANEEVTFLRQAVQELSKEVHDLKNQQQQLQTLPQQQQQNLPGHQMNPAQNLQTQTPQNPMYSMQNYATPGAQGTPQPSLGPQQYGQLFPQRPVDGMVAQHMPMYPQNSHPQMYNHMQSGPYPPNVTLNQNQGHSGHPHQMVYPPQQQGVYPQQQMVYPQQGSVAPQQQSSQQRLQQMIMQRQKQFQASQLAQQRVPPQSNPAQPLRPIQNQIQNSRPQYGQQVPHPSMVNNYNPQYRLHVVQRRGSNTNQ